ncbi:hypothetical protein L0U85_03875 [Glycomyces sp. L485]|uniref:hypothetical protein n=1 Tax=Glycomyces sp. L485 TaxID=2909235 RepID=UPI001F4B950A|nr:hypothetical protein [Glycomyces sp. L485]MCH7230001.1 hypothetical protein [Glycomyces sp. L485]
MHTQTLKTVLRAWAGPTRDRLSASDPARRTTWIIACWETAGGRITTTVLEAATAELHDRFDEAAPGSAEDAVGAGWLEAATAFDARMSDLASGEPRYLAGIGLLTREPSSTGREAMRAVIATGERGAVVYEHRDGGVEASVRCDSAGSVWRDMEHLLIPLECYRALVSGDRPRLPAYAAHGAAAIKAPSTASWAGPC